MKKWIVANLKMNKTYNELDDYSNLLKDLVLESKNKIVVCPSFIALKALGDNFKGTDIMLGAQNCASKIEGSFTGEVSAKMLKSVGAQVVILGHSERRRYYFETDEVIREKLIQALSENLTPIVCLVDADVENVKSNLKSQLEVILKDINFTNIIFAYEPVWAIGTGKTASSEDANEVCKWIRDEIKSLYGDIAEDVN